MAKWKTEFKNQLQFEVDALLNKKVSKRAASNRKGFLLLNRQEEKFLREKGQIGHYRYQNRKLKIEQLLNINFVYRRAGFTAEARNFNVKLFSPRPNVGTGRTSISKTKLNFNFDWSW